MKLIDITAEIEALTFGMDNFVDDNGEISPDFFEKMDELENKLTDKADNYGALLEDLYLDIDKNVAKIDRLKQANERKQKRIEAIESRLKYVMESKGMERLDGTSFAFSFRKSEQTVIDDETKLPEKFRKVEEIPATTRTTYPKDEIKKAIKAGEEVPGAHIVENKKLVMK